MIDTDHLDRWPNSSKEATLSKFFLVFFNRTKHVKLNLRWSKELLQFFGLIAQIVMKLFRKRQSTLPSGDIGHGVALGNKLVPTTQAEVYLAAAPDKEEARRRFMHRLYQLSETHGVSSNSNKGVPAELVLKMSEGSANSSLAEITTRTTTPAIHTAPPSMTHPISPNGSPVASVTPSTASPSRTKDFLHGTEQVNNDSPSTHIMKQDIPMDFGMTREPPFVERQQQQHHHHHHHKALDFGITIEPGCLVGSVQSVISQFAACTDDFFGDKHMATTTTMTTTRCDPRGSRIQVATAVGDEDARGVMSVPSTITFGPSGRALVGGGPLDLRLKRKYSFEEELDSIVATGAVAAEQHNSQSIAYKISDRDGSSLIDHVWVVESFEDEKECPVMEDVDVDVVSMTSSIPTRNSHDVVQ